MKNSIIVRKKILLSIVFIVLIVPLKAISTLRVQWHLDPALQVCWQDLIASQDQLEQYDIITVTKDPDVLLCNKVTEELLATNIPIIILERKDAASVGYENLLLLKNPQIKAIFKNQILANPLLNLEPLGFNDSYHFGLLRAYLPTIPVKYPPHLTMHELNKIQCVIWNIHESAYGHKSCPLREYTIDYTHDRPIDIFFAGTVQTRPYNENGIPLNPDEPNLYQWHREQAVNAVKKLTKFKTVVLDQGQALSYEEYITIMKQAKIVISPWGFGEFCYRDFEAMQCGTILVKPDTSFITYIPNIYQNNRAYVPCTADFSDIQEIITSVLNNYEMYLPMRKYAKELLQNSCSLTDVLQAFALAIHTAVS